MLTLSHFLAKVVYTPEFSNKNFQGFSQQSYNLTLSRFQAKRNLFQCNLDYKHLFIKINQKSITQTI